MVNVVVMLLIGKYRPRETEYIIEDAGAVDLTPWKYRKQAAAIGICVMVLVYVLYSPLGLAK